MTKKVSLIESLTGFSFNLKLLSNRDVVIKTSPDSLLRHGDVMRVANLGMHHFRDTMSNGDLYISFEVLYPSKLNDEARALLAQALPKGVLPKVKESKNEYLLEKI